MSIGRGARDAMRMLQLFVIERIVALAERSRTFAVPALQLSVLRSAQYAKLQQMPRSAGSHNYGMRDVNNCIRIET